MGAYLSLNIDRIAQIEQSNTKNIVLFLYLHVYFFSSKLKQSATMTNQLERL